MHDYFSAWLGKVNVELVDAVARSRWDAVEALVRWATEPKKALRLSAAAVQVESVPEEERQEISRVLQQGDASVPMVGNHVEMQVLAASAIVQLFANEGSVADAAALCVATSTFGDREPEATPGLVSLGHDYLKRRAMRVPLSPDAPQKAAFTSSHASEMTKLSRQVTEALAQTDQASAMETLNNAVSTLTKHLKRVAEVAFTGDEGLIQNQIALSEENDILWWVINGYSGDLNKPRGQATTAELLLPSARELESLVACGVPPAASIEYLRHVLSSAKRKAPQRLTVRDAMEATTLDWRASKKLLLAPEGRERFFPMLAGLRMIGTVSDDGDWHQALQDRTALTTDFAAAPEEIGLHFLRELSLAKRLTSSEPGKE